MQFKTSFNSHRIRTKTNMFVHNEQQFGCKHVRAHRRFLKRSELVLTFQHAEWNRRKLREAVQHVKFFGWLSLGACNHKVVIKQLLKRGESESVDDRHDRSVEKIGHLAHRSEVS